VLFHAGSTDAICFTSGNTLQFFLGGAGTAQLVNTAVYRDPSAWYHVVVAVDTTQATASNRVKCM
jgi:uroporphyrinogen-III synthase